jgi:hypothetical protein
LYGALAGLQRLRAQVRETVLQHRPTETVPSGLLHWLRKRVIRPDERGPLR